MGNVIMKAQQIVYGASNVEKALDDLKAPELIELNKRMAAIDAWKANVHEETYTGSELTIENALALPARSLITEINAIQPLHGLPFPYVGGAYKNKLNYDVWKTVGIIGGSATWENNGVTLTATANDCYTRFLENDYPVGARIPITNGQKITVSWKESTNKHGIVAIFPNANMTGLVTADNANAKQLTYTAKSGDTFITFRFGVTNSGDTISYKDIQFEYGDTATSFAPYSNICPISGRTAATVTVSDGDEISEDFTIQLGQTVYGADINWDTGVMTIDRAYVKVKDLTWRIQSSAYARFITGSLIDTIKKSNTDYVCISDSYESRSNQDALMNYNQIYSNASGDVKIGDAEYVPSTIEQWLATRGETEIVYKLATPTTIQLTPTQLEMLKGYNRVTLADGYGEIELKALVLGGDN